MTCNTPRPIHTSPWPRVAIVLSVLVGSLIVWLPADVALASCNDLVVDLERAPGWRITSAECEEGDVVSQSSTRVELESGLVHGPDCRVTFQGPGGGSTVRVQQNYCGLQAGALTIQTQAGAPPSHCAQEGSYASSRGGRVTFGDFRWTGAASPDRQLRLATYNVFDRNLNVSTDGQDRRMEHLPAVLRTTIPDLDVVVVQEAFNTDVVTYGLCVQGLVHQTPVITDPTINSVENGGVLIASRWPITRRAQHVFRDACAGADCLAAKGVVYARVEKGSSRTPFHVFGTHLQADAEYHQIRLKQAAQMQEFASKQNIPKDEPVLFAGDFNVDHLSHPSRVAQIAAALGAAVPGIPNGEATSSPKRNQLVGQDGAAAAHQCCGSYSSRSPHRCDCCPEEWLDYVFASTKHRGPAQPLQLQRFQAQTRTPFAIEVDPFRCDDDDSTWRVRDVSDHDPVATTSRY